MKKRIWIDIILCSVVVVSTTVLIRPIVVDVIATTQAMNQKSVEQITTKALSLFEGDGEIITSSQIEYPTEGQAYAVIHNDDRGFSKDLYFGDTNPILDISIGQYTKTGIPGEGRPILLAGHNGTHFRLLPSFEVGDHIQIDTSYGKYVYEVESNEIKLVSDFSTSVLDEKEEKLILYTCYPFNVIDTDQRYFVYAKKIAGPIIKEDGSWKK